MGVQATRAALHSNGRILLLHQKVELEEGEDVAPEHLHAIGAVANIIESYEPGDGTIRIAIACRTPSDCSRLYKDCRFFAVQRCKLSMKRSG